MKGCFTKVPQAVCNCHQQRYQHYFLQRGPSSCPKKHQFSYIPTNLVKCCQLLHSLLQEKSLERIVISKSSKMNSKNTRLETVDASSVLAMGNYWINFLKSLNLSNCHFLVYRISIWGSIPAFCMRDLKLQQTLFSFWLTCN